MRPVINPEKKCSVRGSVHRFFLAWVRPLGGQMMSYANGVCVIYLQPDDDFNERM